MAGKGWARTLGAVSLGLGAAELLAPRDVAECAGARTEDSAQDVVRALGARELVTAAGLFASSRSAPWLWARVAGDAMDLGLLTRGLGGRGHSRAVRATAVVGAIAAVDLAAAMRASRAGSAKQEMVAVTTVNRPAEEAYRQWRDLAGLPRFMAHLRQVQVTGETTSRWTADAPGRRTVQWDAQIVADEPGQRLAWRSVGRSKVPNSGEVSFTPAPGGRGTEVRVRLEFSVPGGRAGALFATLFGEAPDQQVEDDLRRFKQVVETGEVLLSDGSPEGTFARRQALQRPAQPSGRRHDAGTPGRKGSGS